MAKRVTTQLVKQLICILMVAVVLAPIILVCTTPSAEAASSGT